MGKKAKVVTAIIWQAIPEKTLNAGQDEEQKGVSFSYLVYGTKGWRNSDSREHNLYPMPS